MRFFSILDLSLWPTRSNQLYTYDWCRPLSWLHEKVWESQQVFPTRLGGIECLDKALFFRRTKKGGRHSGGLMTTLKSKLVPIARLVQRRMLWVCNLVPEDFFSVDYIMPSHENDVFTDDNNDDIIFDTKSLEVV